MATSNQGAHLVCLVGLGVSPSHTLSIAALHFLFLNKEELKYLFCLGELVGCLEIVSIRGD